MPKRILKLIAAVYICVAISVYALHLYVLITDPKATKDGQYAISFTMTGAFGWIAGTAFYFWFRHVEKKRPRVTPYLYAVFSLYAVLLAAFSVVYEAQKMGPSATNTSTFLIGYLPFLVVLSPLGLLLVAMAPSFLWIELAAFSPLVLFLALLSRLPQAPRG